jgi:hypothetical protein
MSCHVQYELSACHWNTVVLNSGPFSMEIISSTMDCVIGYCGGVGIGRRSGAVGV